MKKLRSTILYILYLIFVVIVFNYVCHYIYMIKLSSRKPKDVEYQKLKNVDMQTAKRLGRIYNDQISGFYNFEEMKKANTIRIGCFGDSFTQGYEVNEINDYPNILNNIFISRGYKNIEVINFGNGSAGFHQAFIMWKYVGRNYNLDYILLGPSCFQARRDTSFNPDRFPYYIHSRYIIKEDTLELVDISGDNLEKTFRNYNSFFPDFNALIYDRNLPAFLRSMIMRKKRTFANPFYYYSGSMKQEAHTTYRLLLSEMADDNVQIILGHYNKDIVEIGRGLNRNNLFPVKLYWDRNFPNLAFMGHNSPFGNYIVAKQYYDILTNKKEINFELLKTSDLGDTSYHKNREFLELSKYDSMAIEINNTKIGYFTSSEKDGDWYVLKVFKKINCVSLLSIKDPKKSLLDSCFLPLDFKINKGMQLILRIKIDSKYNDYLLGKIDIVMPPKINIGKVDVDGIFFTKYTRILTFEGEMKGSDNVSFLLDDKLIMKGHLLYASQGMKVKLNPVRKKFLRICPSGDENLIKVEDLNKTGTIFLAVQKREDVRKIPFARWEKTTKIVPISKKFQDGIFIKN